MPLKGRGSRRPVDGKRACRGRGLASRVGECSVLSGLEPTDELHSSGGLGKRGLALGIGPVEPGCERGEICGFDGRAAPDAQAGWSVAVSGDIKGRLLLLEQRLQLFDEGALPIER